VEGRYEDPFANRSGARPNAAVCKRLMEQVFPPIRSVPTRLKHYWKQRLWATSPTLFDRLSVNDPEQLFSIGVFAGPSPFELSDCPAVCNPVLTPQHITDVPAAFVADPFMLQRDGGWHMFFEVLNRATRSGEIGHATSPDGYVWTYRKIVLREQFHLAYPCVFEWRDDVYLIPDSPSAGIRLYRAKRFPDQWQFVASIATGGSFWDSTAFHDDGRWWLHTVWSPQRGARQSLRLFLADEPAGPWHEHPCSPVVCDTTCDLRAAGRTRIVDGRVVRFTQHGEPHYGTSVSALEIAELSTERYVERTASLRTVLSGSGQGWNASGMHHVDAHPLADGSWIACVDGWR
jgi:hypothetical protein